MKRFKPTQPSWRQRLALRLLTLPEWLLEKLAGGAVQVDGETLHPSLVLIGRRMARDMPNMTPEEARRELRQASGLIPSPTVLMDRLEELGIPTESGSDLTARLYTPPDLPQDPPGLVYFHGGGWVIGDLDTHDTICRLIACQTPCKVLSVDYRLAPEHRFPAPMDDALAAFRFAAREAADLGIDSRRLAVGGDSAGGTLATVVAQQCRSADASPCGQLLIYPVTDIRRGTRSHELFAEGYGLSASLMDWFLDHFLESPEQIEDPRASPLLAESVEGLPPTVLVVAGFDVLRDEAREYGARLQQAGVSVSSLEVPLIHGFAQLAGLPICRQALDRTISELAELFRRAL